MIGWFFFFLSLTARLSSPSTTSPLALQARGGGEYDISDADIQNFYNNLLTGAGGDPPKVGGRKRGNWMKVDSKKQGTDTFWVDLLRWYLRNVVCRTSF